MDIEKLEIEGKYKMYGPYEAQDGRLRVIHKNTETGERRTQSYPRYVMERLLNRKLFPHEVVDHIDNDPTNNDPNNFQLLTYAENNTKAREYHGNEARTYSFICPECGEAAEKSRAIVDSNRTRKPGLRGPYCSRSCSGKAIYKLRGGVK